MISIVAQPVTVIAIARTAKTQNKPHPHIPTQPPQAQPLQPPSSNPLHHQKASPTFQPDYPVSIAQAIVPPHIDHSICLGLVFRDLD